MIVPIDSYLQHACTSRRMNSLELLQYARDIQFKDEQTGKVRTLVAVTKKSEDVQDLWIKTWRTLDDMPEIMHEKERAVILIWHDRTKDPLFMIQVEYEPPRQERKSSIERKASSCAQSEIDPTPKQGGLSKRPSVLDAETTGNTELKSPGLQSNLKWKNLASGLGGAARAPDVKQFRWIEASVLRLVFQAV